MKIDKQKQFSIRFTTSWHHDYILTSLSQVLPHIHSFYSLMRESKFKFKIMALGRPSCSKIELDLNDHEEFLDKIKHLQLV